METNGKKPYLVKVKKELFEMICSYILDGEFEENLGAERDSLVDDCTAAKIYDALLAMRQKNERG